MIVADVLNIQGNKVSSIELEDSIFNVPVKNHILHEVVRMQLANRRSGTASIKNRSDVKGSGRKLYRQKGTGNARPGDIKSPLRRVGGVIFGPKPRSYQYKVPKKVRKQALCMSLSNKVQEKNFIIVDNFDLPEIKTSLFVNALNSLNLEVEPVLIVTDQPNLNLELSSRNIGSTKLLKTEGLNVYDILKYKKLVVVESAIDKICKRLGA